MLHAVIMAGGSGTRFWPRSRPDHPKQFIRILGDRTMIQETVARLDGLLPAERTWVVTCEEQIALAREQLPDLPGENLIAEPCGRDTAACIGLAASLLARRDPEGVMVVMPADHWIRPAAAFQRAIVSAASLAVSESVLVTFGVRPTTPATGYGYIEAGEPFAERNGSDFLRVVSFREKPDRATAESFVRTGSFYWNAGIFVWKASRILTCLRNFLPDHAERLDRIADAWGTSEEPAVLAREYPSLDRISIDYGVMEKAAASGGVAVAPVAFEWDDVGSWEALARRLPVDADGNRSEGGRHRGFDTRDCILVSEPGHTIATVGVEGLVVVQTPGATLICPRDRAEEVKRLQGGTFEKSGSLPASGEVQ